MLRYFPAMLPAMYSRPNVGKAVPTSLLWPVAWLCPMDWMGDGFMQRCVPAVELVLCSIRPSSLAVAAPAAAASAAVMDSIYRLIHVQSWEPFSLTRSHRCLIPLLLHSHTRALADTESHLDRPLALFSFFLFLLFFFYLSSSFLFLPCTLLRHCVLSGVSDRGHFLSR
jgi:hypothetical protein